MYTLTNHKLLRSKAVAFLSLRVATPYRPSQYVPLGCGCTQPD